MKWSLSEDGWTVLLLIAVFFCSTVQRWNRKPPASANTYTSPCTSSEYRIENSHGIFGCLIMICNSNVLFFFFLSGVTTSISLLNWKNCIQTSRRSAYLAKNISRSVATDSNECSGRKQQHFLHESTTRPSFESTTCRTIKVDEGFLLDSLWIDGECSSLKCCAWLRLATSHKFYSCSNLWLIVGTMIFHSESGLN